MKILSRLLSSDEVGRLTDHDMVRRARQELDRHERGQKTFHGEIPDDIRLKLSESFGVELGMNLPMRWIRGDSMMHRDHAWDHQSFQNTYLVYLSDSDGVFHVGGEEHPIRCGDGYCFHEGISHGTIGARGDRLILGPFNERSVAVGFPPGIKYTDGVTFYVQPVVEGTLLSVEQINAVISEDPPFIIPSGQQQIGWMYNLDQSYSTSVPSNLTQLINGAIPIDGNIYPINSTYNADTTGNDNGGIVLFPVYGNGDVPCFKEGTRILVFDETTQSDVYKPIETLRVNDRVKTYRHTDYKEIAMIGRTTIHNPDNKERIKNRLYRLSKDVYPDLIDDVYITGSHAILVDDITPQQRADIIHHFERIYVTENKYRLMACVDERAEPWEKDGLFNIYHFALDDPNERRNFGVYANGLLVETTSTWSFKKKVYTPLT